MSKSKVKRYIKLLKNISDDDLKYLIKHTYVNGCRQNEAAWSLYRGLYKESSYNLFYIAAEEYFKCLRLLHYFGAKQKGQQLSETEFGELANLFVYHMFKMEHSKNFAVENIKGKRLYVSHNGQKGFSRVEGEKVKERNVNRLNRFTSEELFDLKNESVYVGYREKKDEVISPTDNFHYEYPNIMMEVIRNLHDKAHTEVHKVFSRAEIDQCLKYKMLIGTRHSDRPPK